MRSPVRPLTAEGRRCAYSGNSIIVMITSVIITMMLNGTPMRMKSAKLELPRPTTSVLTGETPES